MNIYHEDLNGERIDLHKGFVIPTTHQIYQIITKQGRVTNVREISKGTNGPIHKRERGPSYKH